MRDRPHNDCPGPPASRIDTDEKLKEYAKKREESDETRWSSRLLPHHRGNALLEEQNRENFETVQKPLQVFLLSKGSQYLRKDLTVEDFAQLADEGIGPGHQACAWHAAVCYKHRILGKTKLNRTRNGNRSGLVVDNSGSELSVLESQELAFHYFERASKLGHALSMQSFGECYDEGIGCRVNRRHALKWLWRSCLLHSGGAYQMLESRALLTIEINAISEQLQNAKDFLQPYQKLQTGGPNLGIIFVCLLPVLSRNNYSLPPFAGAKPSGTVGNSIIPNTGDRPRIPIIGYGNLKEVQAMADSMYQQGGNQVNFIYGRRGTMKSATAQTRGRCDRSLDNQVFVVPPAPGCDESMTGDELDTWIYDANMLKECGSNNAGIVIKASCTHLERSGSREGGAVVCQQCVNEAADRLWAVSRGKVVISENENIPNFGQAVIFQKPNGSIVQETWKTYAGGEAECALAAFVLNGEELYFNPLFVAQDPNFFWPLIADHGSIRAAFEFVAPHVDWNAKLGIVKPPPIQIPIVPGTTPGKHLRKCGNDFCNKVEKFGKSTFFECSNCNRRMYCSGDCSSTDWDSHKRECKAASKGVVPKGKRAIPKESKRNNDGEQKYPDEPMNGCDVVIRDLVSKKEYNGKVGFISEEIKDGRFAVTLRTKDKKTISIKPQNLSSIGSFSKSRRKKSRVFECFHGLQVCKKCYSDFTMANRLAKLKYQGDEMTESIIDRIVDSHYASIENENEDGEIKHSFHNAWPFECHGMDEHPERRFILKALLETDVDMTVCALAARAAMVSYGARIHNVMIPNTSAHLVALSEKLNEY